MLHRIPRVVSATPVAPVGLREAARAIKVSDGAATASLTSRNGDMKDMALRIGTVLATAYLLVVPATAPLRAQGVIHEVKIGGLFHDPGDLWSGFRREPQSLDINLEVQLRPHVQVLWGSLRPALGVTVNTEGATSKGYLDARWEIESRTGLFFATGVGIAIHDGNTGPTAIDRKALGARALFHIPAEIGWRWDGRNSLSVYFEHISNGYTKDYNEGLDALGMRYGYRF